MNRRLIPLLATFALAGCSSERMSQQVDVPFETANAKLQTLYPSVLSMQPIGEAASPIKAKLDGPLAAVLRDESRPGEVSIFVVEGEPKGEGEAKATRRSEIILTQLGAQRSEVSVQTSNSLKAALVPTRDHDYEQARLDEIVNAFK